MRKKSCAACEAFALEEVEAHNYITRHLMFRCPSEGQAFAMFDHLVIHVWLKENRAELQVVISLSSAKITRPAHVEESFSFAPCRSRIGVQGTYPIEAY